MTTTIKTPVGHLVESGLMRRAVASIADLCMLSALLGALVGIMEAVGLDVLGLQPSRPTFVALAVIGLGIIVGNRLLRMRSPGQWALGLRCFSFSELIDFAGKGVVWCIEQHPAREYTRRTLIVIGCYGFLYLVSWFGITYAA